MTELQSIRALRDYSLKLQPNIRREVNKLADEVESEISELEHMVETRDESIHNLVGIADKRQERIKELEAERDEYYDGYQALMNRCAKLTALVRDLWCEILREFPRGGFCDMGRYERRIHELGIEVRDGN